MGCIILFANKDWLTIWRKTTLNKSLFTFDSKVNSMWLKTLNVKGRIINQIKENVGEYLCDFQGEIIKREPK